MATVTASYDLTTKVNASFPSQSLGTTKNNFTVGPYSGSFTSGTGPGQVNEEWSDSIDFLASTPQTLDLQAMAGGENARAVTFSRAKLIKVKNTHATLSVVVGGAATNAFLPGWSAATNTDTIGPGGVRFYVEAAVGFLVDATHSDFLLTPGAGAMSVEVTVLGLA